MRQFMVTGFFSIALIMFSLFSTGCVSKGTFQIKLDENQALSGELEKSRARVKALEKRGEELAKLNSGLTADLTMTSKTLKDREKRIEEIERQFSDEKESGSEALKRFSVEKSEIKESFQNSMEEWDVTKKELLARMDAKDLEITRLGQENGELRKTLDETTFEKEKKARELKEAGRAHREFVKKLTNEINDGVIKISRLKNSLSVEIVDSILFDSGSVYIKPAGREVLKKMSRVLTEVKENNIRVEGHTDNIPIGKELKKKYPSNWELSSARATEVVRYLALQGVEPEKLVPVGFSRFRPVVSNDSSQGRKQNRRIEIVLFPRDIQDIVRSVDEGTAFR